MNAKIPDSWRISELTKGDKTYLVRMNTGLWKIAESNDLPYQIGVAMPLKHPTVTGFPTGEENLQLNELEDTFLEQLNKKNSGLVFAGNITGGGIREFVFYAPMPAKIDEIIKELEKETGYSLQTNIQEDKEWNIFKSLCPQSSTDTEN